MQRLLQARETTLRFLRWWYRELKSCATDLLSEFAPWWRRPLIIYVDSRRLVIAGADRWDTPLIDLPRTHFREPLPSQLPGATALALSHGRRAALLVSASEAFRRTFTLPLAAVPHLRSAVALQLPKLLPVDPSLLMSDFEISRTDHEKGFVHIALVALKRNEVEVIASAISDWGFRILRVQMADDPRSVPRFRFSSGSGATALVERRSKDRFWLGATAVLGLTCVAVGATQSYRAEASLNRAQLQTSAASAAAMQHEQKLLSRLEPLTTLAQLESGPTGAAVLGEITALMPHDTWLTTFEIKGSHVRLVGISPNPATLVRFLNASSLLDDFELRSSMSAGIGTEKDRFEITAEFKAPRP
jgi:Tfp pilus assembly protein PilN